MVYVEGNSQPVVKHITYQSAYNEAKRLAKLQNKRVYILGTIKSIEIFKFIEKNCCVGEF